MKAMKWILIALLAVLLSACGQDTAGEDESATQVAGTVIAAFTSTALNLPTDTADPTAPPAATDTPQAATEAPTETPEPTATATETAEPTETATATLNAGDPRQTLGNPTRVLDFDSRNWFLYEDSHLKMDIVNGQLELVAFEPENWEGWSTTGYHLENFYLEVTGQTGDECSGRDRYGMIVRADDPNEGYLFGISCDGYFRLRSWDSETFTTLLDWTPSSQINVGPEETNRFGLMARGSELRLYINGVEVVVIQDNEFKRGAFGIFISSAATEDFTVTISDVRYWELP